MKESTGGPRQVIRHGKLGGWVVEVVFWVPCYHCGFGRWSGFEISQTQVLKDFFEKGLYGPKCGRIWQCLRVDTLRNP